MQPNNVLQGLSALNPICNDSDGRDLIERRPSLSAAVGREESRLNAKPPLFRHQMLRVSEPDYSASQNNSL